jgi:hypothetical protein
MDDGLLAPRETPWKSWMEWIGAFVALWSRHSSPEAIQQASTLLHAWAMRGKCPPAVEASETLVPLVRLSIDALLSRDERGSALRLAALMAIVRLVNGVADSKQLASRALSVVELAVRAGIPRSLVDLRHAATHARQPAPRTIQSGVSSAADWCLECYWLPTLRQIDPIGCLAQASPPLAIAAANLLTGKQPCTCGESSSWGQCFACKCAAAVLAAAHGEWRDPHTTRPMQLLPSERAHLESLRWPMGVVVAVSTLCRASDLAASSPSDWLTVAESSASMRASRAAAVASPDAWCASIASACKSRKLSKAAKLAHDVVHSMESVRRAKRARPTQSTLLSDSARPMPPSVRSHIHEEADSIVVTEPLAWLLAIAEADANQTPERQKDSAQSVVSLAAASSAALAALSASARSSLLALEWLTPVLLDGAPLYQGALADCVASTLPEEGEAHALRVPRTAKLCSTHPTMSWLAASVLCDAPSSIGGPLTRAFASAAPVAHWMPWINSLTLEDRTLLPSLIVGACRRVLAHATAEVPDADPSVPEWIRGCARFCGCAVEYTVEKGSRGPEDALLQAVVLRAVALCQQEIQAAAVSGDVVADLARRLGAAVERSKGAEGPGSDSSPSAASAVAGVEVSLPTPGMLDLEQLEALLGIDSVGGIDT